MYAPPSAASHGIKVIGAGPGRTGTASFAASLEDLGYKPYRMKDCFSLDHADMWQRALDRQSVDEVASVLTSLGYDAILDEPGSDMVPLLAEKFPDAKVVMTHRNPAAWIQSLEKLADLHSELSKAPYTFLPAVQRFSSLSRRILAKRHCYFADATSRSDACLQWYHSHVANLRVLFAREKNRFLEYQIEDGWEPLTQFLNQTGHPATAHPFPDKNRHDEISTVASLLWVLRVLLYVASSVGALSVLIARFGKASIYRQRTRSPGEEKTVRIRGLTSVIPGVNGVPGFIGPTKAVCAALRDRGIHNPSKNKPISDDWAERYLNMTTVAVGEVDLLRGQYGNKYCTIPHVGNSSEEDLMFQAFDEAVEKANIKVEDVDVLIYVSCTVDGVYFNDNMRQWWEKYPKLSRRLLPMTLPLGCPSYIYSLQIAQRFLQSNQVENVAIVMSNSTSKRFTPEGDIAVTQGNDMRLWLNSLIFGDAAFACVVSTSTENMPARTYKLLDADLVIDPEVFISSRVPVNVGGPGTKPYDLFYLNPLGTKHIPPSLTYWFGHMKEKYGYTLESFQHIVFHQANPKVIFDVCKKLGCLDKTSVTGAKYGNTGGTSIGVALHDRLEKSKELPKDKDLIMGYALGAHTGNTHGIFLMECEVRE